MSSYADFLSSLGHTVVEEAGVLWYDAQPRVFLAIPYHQPISVSEAAIASLMKTHHLLGLRFATFSSGFGFASNVAVNRDHNYSLSSLHVKARNQTRRGLERCTVKQIDFKYLERHGMPLNVQTAKRQGIRNPFVSPGYWRRFCEAASSCDAMSAWAAFVEDQMGAYLVAAEVGGWSDWLVNHSSTQFRSIYPNNALAFTAATRLLTDTRVEGICYGLGSLEPTPDLDRFKERMGWDLMQVRQRLVVAKPLELATHLVPQSMVRQLGRHLGKTVAPRKALAFLERYKEQSVGAVNPPETLR